MPSPSPDPVSARVEGVTTELRELIQVLKSGEIDDHTLSEFRQTIDYIRMTAWARHQVNDKRAHRGDLRSVLSLLASDRISRATQLARDIHEDLHTTDVSPKTEGLKGLFEALEPLYKRLATVFVKS